MKLLEFKMLNHAAPAAALLLAVAVAQASVSDPAAQEIVARTRAAYAALSSYSDSGRVTSQLPGQNLTVTFNTRLERPNHYRIDWLNGPGLKGVVWSSGNGDFLQIDPGSAPASQALAALAASGLKNDRTPQKLPNLRAALSRATGTSYSAAAVIPGAFFDQNCGDVFAYPAIAGRYPVHREKDEPVGNVDCYVVSTEMDLSKVPEAGKPGTVSATLWIGKTDFLIRQTRTRYVEKVDEQALASDSAIDEAIKKSLEMQHKPVTPEAVAAMRPQMRAIMKQVQGTLKTEFQAGIVMTQTHENIALNPKFTSDDFAH